MALHLRNPVPPSEDEVHHQVVNELVQALVDVLIEEAVADLLEDLLVVDPGPQLHPLVL